MLSFSENNKRFSVLQIRRGKGDNSEIIILIILGGNLHCIHSLERFL